MSTKTSTRKPRSTNTPAPTAGQRADVMATGAAPAAPQAATPVMPATPPEDAAKLPPEGEIEQARKVTGVYVISRQEGFRRAGRAWSAQPTTVPVDELSEEQIEALVREPMLRVAFVADTDEKVAG
jgi:hypothetical protein